ncbi:hypothetical protein GCM10009836_14210 [Pseudonocardia ailaonensis]|uniref:Histidine kinase/HSP90-like ATPase domain-containing protein n=1 Tax=Pseudonocardia ailaonensis TaxID=367279 RepID=A0ABN2MSQ4_9PSEU
MSPTHPENHSARPETSDTADSAVPSDAPDAAVPDDTAVPLATPAEILAAVTAAAPPEEDAAALTGLAESVEYVHRSWPADASQLSVIRHELLGWLAPLGLDTDQTDDVVLAVDEAVANAVRHAYPDDHPGDVQVTLWTEGQALCIEITDHGSWRPTGGVVTADGRGGRGMLLMQHMVETVLVHFDDRGSRVLLRHRFGESPSEPARHSA